MIAYVSLTGFMMALVVFFVFPAWIIHSLLRLAKRLEGRKLARLPWTGAFLLWLCLLVLTLSGFGVLVL